MLIYNLKKLVSVLTCILLGHAAVSQDTPSVEKQQRDLYTVRNLGGKRYEAAKWPSPRDSIGKYWHVYKVAGRKWDVVADEPFEHILDFEVTADRDILIAGSRHNTSAGKPQLMIWRIDGNRVSDSLLVSSFHYLRFDANHCIGVTTIADTTAFIRSYPYTQLQNAGGAPIGNRQLLPSSIKGLFALRGSGGADSLYTLYREENGALIVLESQLERLSFLPSGMVWLRKAGKDRIGVMEGAALRQSEAFNQIILPKKGDRLILAMNDQEHWFYLDIPSLESTAIKMPDSLHLLSAISLPRSKRIFLRASTPRTDTAWYDYDHEPGKSGWTMLADVADIQPLSGKYVMLRKKSSMNRLAMVELSDLSVELLNEPLSSFGADFRIHVWEDTASRSRKSGFLVMGKLDRDQPEWRGGWLTKYGRVWTFKQRKASKYFVSDDNRLFYYKDQNGFWKVWDAATDKSLLPSHRNYILVFPRVKNQIAAVYIDSGNEMVESIPVQ